MRRHQAQAVKWIVSTRLTKQVPPVLWRQMKLVAQLVVPHRQARMQQHHPPLTHHQQLVRVEAKHHPVLHLAVKLASRCSSGS